MYSNGPPATQFGMGGLPRDVRLLNQISNWPSGLDPTDFQLLDRYVRLFSKTYPTCTDSTNPFLRVFVLLSTQSRPVLDAMLALSCVQSWEDGDFTMKIPMLRYRARAIRGCRDMLNNVMKLPCVHHELHLPHGTVNERSATSRVISGPSYTDINI